MASPAHTQTNLSLTEGDRSLLESLAKQLDCSRADAVRWGLAALRGILRDGLDGSTTREFFKDGRRVVILEGERGKALTLAERLDGSFGPGRDES